MKEIVVRVPESFHTPESLLSDDAHKVITIGDIIYTKGAPEAQDDTECIHMREKMEQMTASHTEQVKHMLMMHKSLQEQNERMTKEFMLSTHRMREEKDAMASKESASNIEIIQKIDSLLGNGNALDNIEKGNFGEEYVTNAILHEFPESIVDDVSGDTAHGDCIWKMDSSSFRCLVEVKNVAQSKNLDVGKFVRDMHVNLANGEANCGMFVSLKTENIPTKGKCKLEYIQQCPVIYVSGVWKNPAVFHFALRLMRNIAQHNERSDNQVDVLHMQEYMSKTYDAIMKQQAFIHDLRRIVDKTNIMIQKAQKNITESILYMEESMTRHGVSPNVQVDDAIEKVKQYKEIHGKWPTAATCGVPKESYTSFKDLLQRAKQTI